MFRALKNKDGTPFTSPASAESFMFWEMSANSGPESFALSEFWLKRICYEYESHEQNEYFEPLPDNRPCPWPPFGDAAA